MWRRGGCAAAAVSRPVGFIDIDRRSPSFVLAAGRGPWCCRLFCRGEDSDGIFKDWPSRSRG